MNKYLQTISAHYQAPRLSSQKISQPFLAVQAFLQNNPQVSLLTYYYKALVPRVHSFLQFLA